MHEGTLPVPIPPSPASLPPFSQHGQKAQRLRPSPPSAGSAESAIQPSSSLTSPALRRSSTRSSSSLRVFSAVCPVLIQLKSLPFDSLTIKDVTTRITWTPRGSVHMTLAWRSPATSAVVLAATFVSVPLRSHLLSRRRLEEMMEMQAMGRRGVIIHALSGSILVVALRSYVSFSKIVLEFRAC